MAGFSVIAKKDGYYGLKRRKAGERFAIEKDSDFSKKWMERLTSKEHKDVVEEDAEQKASRRKRKDIDEETVI